MAKGNVATPTPGHRVPASSCKNCGEVVWRGHRIFLVFSRWVHALTEDARCTQEDVVGNARRLKSSEKRER